MNDTDKKAQPPAPPVSGDFWDSVYEWLEGTCHSEHAVIEYFGWDGKPEDVIEAMLDRNLEMCPDCGWWTESGELTDENNDPAPCEQCRND